MKTNQDIPTGSLFDTDDGTTDNHNLDHREALELGPYPQTVAVTLWGLDTIKTKGESVAILLGLVGAEPVREVSAHVCVCVCVFVYVCLCLSVCECVRLDDCGLCSSKNCLPH